MKILVNVFHPHLESSSVNAAWISELRRTEKTTINNTYANYPDLHIDVAREQKLLLEHDRIVFQYPFYWYSSPSLMKKWIDDVLTLNWAYGPEGTALHGKDWISAISTGGKHSDYQAGGSHNYSISEFMKPVQQTAILVGMNYLPPYVFHDALKSSDLRVTQSAKKYLLHITKDGLKPSAPNENYHIDDCEICSPLRH
ncbi:MAG: NAD(P)H-dependent oxidoreductase [Granulosicoccus sp.]